MLSRKVGPKSVLNHSFERRRVSQMKTSFQERNRAGLAKDNKVEILKQLIEEGKTRRFGWMMNLYIPKTTVYMQLG